ncbi:hypothetical protein XELAEV_18028465mg [Xenopus laevis]|uniref:Uncharacterized protein n=1 Tax=Xenopus laevis TaxID=8355 RepID=A0A974CZT3_XENLA|nr:hypothetical protein XELAEV_18028465mg [Xenopus laevis]
MSPQETAIGWWADTEMPPTCQRKSRSQVVSKNKLHPLPLHNEEKTNCRKIRQVLSTNNINVTVNSMIQGPPFIWGPHSC